MKKSLDIITSNAVQEKYSGNIVQKMAESFVQLQSVHKGVVAYLQQHGLALSSRTWPSFAYPVRADHFGKVTNIIRALSDRLEREAAAEASHKVRGACGLRIGVILFSVRFVVFLLFVNFFFEAWWTKSCTRTRRRATPRLSRL